MSPYSTSSASAPGMQNLCKTAHKPACAQMHKRPDKKWCLQNGGTFENATFLQEKGEEKESFIKHLSYQAIIDNY